jgi:hypothetical protein
MIIGVLVPGDGEAPGNRVWVSSQLPGSTQDTAATRIWDILAALEQAGLIPRFLGNFD